MNSATPQAANNNAQPKYRVSLVEAAAMELLACLGDTVGLIPIVGFIGTIMCGGGVVMWLYFKGVKPIDFKKTKKAVGKIANVLGNGVAEGATGAVFPSVIIYTSVALAMAYWEDKTAGNTLPTPPATNMRQLKQRDVARTAQNDNAEIHEKAA